jgi:hypothetical protein
MSRSALGFSANSAKLNYPQIREIFVDHLGRAVSPSMASQYSPPSSTSETELWSTYIPTPSALAPLAPPQYGFVPYGPPNGMFHPPVMFGYAPPPPPMGMYEPSIPVPPVGQGIPAGFVPVS